MEAHGKAVGFIPQAPLKMAALFVVYPLVTGMNVSMLFVLHDRLTLLSELGMAIVVLFGIIFASSIGPFSASILFEYLGHGGLPLFVAICAFMSLCLLMISAAIAKREKVYFDTRVCHYVPFEAESSCNTVNPAAVK